jgi:predicted Ser/Thr protein kinase
MLIKEFKKGVSTEKLELHEINNELLVYKYLKTDNKFRRETIAYCTLSDCDFVAPLVSTKPEEKLIITKYVGESLNLKYLPKDRHKFKAEIKRMNDTLTNNYGIYHNDIRWKNVVESDSGKLFLIDFESWTTLEKGPRERDPEKILRS